MRYRLRTLVFLTAALPPIIGAIWAVRSYWPDIGIALAALMAMLVIVVVISTSFGGYFR